MPNSSTSDMYTITPPENPREKVSNFVSVRFMKKITNPPIPVARPAKVVIRRT